MSATEIPALTSEGLIYRVPGRGTYPVDQADRYLRHFGSIEDLMSLSVDTDCEIISPLQRRVDLAAASRLRLASDDVYSVTFVRRHDGCPSVTPPSSCRRASGANSRMSRS